MRFDSITVKLLAIIVGAFVAMLVVILILADLQLKGILDQSQEALYTERIDTITGFLERSHERLKKTGLVEAYADDFKQSALTFLRNSYYREPDPAIYPFIIDTGGTVIMHPALAKGEQSLKETPIAKHLLSADDGQFEAIHAGQPKWYRYRAFDAWGWVIAYTVPLSIKYRDAHVFRNTLIIITACATAAILLVLAFIVRRFTRPIIVLTEAARHVARGDLDRPVNSGGNDEIGVLARTFISMRDAIQKQIQDLNNEIKERQQAEAALQESEARLSEAQKLAGLGYWEWTIETGDVTWSDEVYRIFRLHPETFTPAIDAIMALSPWPEQNRRHEELIQRSVEKKEKGTFDQKFMRPDGSIGYYQSTFKGRYDADGKLISIGGTVLDITERKKQESELQQLRNYLSNIINSMPSMLVGVTPDGTITQWNREAKQVTGLSAQDVTGKPLDRVLPRFAEEMQRVRRAIRTRQELLDPKRSRQENGHTIYEDITIYPLIANGVEGAVIRIDDVTEQVRMEEMMIQSEKMLSVGGLAAGMAHEINNPLAGMIQTARVMANRLEKNSTIEANLKAAESAGTSMKAIGIFMEERGILRMVDTIVESGQRVAEIVANMLSFARKSESEAAAPHSLADLLNRTIELAATDYDMKKHYDFKVIEIVKQYDENLPDVPCEAAKIQQVLLNILRNGTQAMQEDANCDNPRFIVRTYLDKKTTMACLEIEDNGPGMDEATRKRIFEPFFTTKPVGVGTGLGLSVSYFIITENHNGQMNVESSPGKGTTFTIRLPMQGNHA